jgi:hypothetical protein
MKKLLIILLFGLSNLASAYDRSEAIEALQNKNYKVAHSKFKAAAENGDLVSQWFLGTIYQNGNGVSKDMLIAKYWYEESALQGYADAQNNLSILYSLGKESDRDYLKAYMWANLASFNGSTKASKFRDSISTLMSEDDVNKSQQMSKRCLESNYKRCE